MVNNIIKYSQNLGINIKQACMFIYEITTQD